MAATIFELLKKRGIVVPENQIQSIMPQWDQYQLLNNNPSFDKKAKHNPGSKHIGDQHRYW